MRYTMFEIFLVFLVIFISMTGFVLFIDVLSSAIEIQFHSAHHNRKDLHDTDNLVD